MEDDFRAVTKLKMRYCPEEITEEEKRNYAHRGIAEPATRAVRDVVRRACKKLPERP